MSFWSKIKGTIESAFQIGLGGPLWKNDSGVLDARDPTDISYVIVRGADPINPNDLVTKQYGDANYTGGGGGSAHVGSAIIDFGIFPGKDAASVTVTGQTGILVTSVVEAWLYPKAATPEHSIDEHRIEQMDVLANGDSIVPGASFTITAKTRNTLLYGEYYAAWYWANP